MRTNTILKSEVIKAALAWEADRSTEPQLVQAVRALRSASAGTEVVRSAPLSCVYDSAYAEFDYEANEFRVFLTRTDDKDSDQLRSEFEGDALMVRLYKAAFVACPKDIGNLKITPGKLECGWDKNPPAQRVAKAVERELGRIAKGDPPISEAVVQLALQMIKR